MKMKKIMMTNSIYQAYQEAQQREKLLRSELARMRRRAETAEKKNIVLAAEVSAWQQRASKLEKSNK